MIYPVSIDIKHWTHIYQAPFFFSHSHICVKREETQTTLASFEYSLLESFGGRIDVLNLNQLISWFYL